MSGNGFRKILENESTTQSTAEGIAFHLGVHINAITGEEEPLRWREGTANDAYKDILHHDRVIERLKNHIIKLYDIVGKKLSDEEIEKLGRP